MCSLYRVRIERFIFITWIKFISRNNINEILEVLCKLFEECDLYCEIENVSLLFHWQALVKFLHFDFYNIVLSRTLFQHVALFVFFDFHICFSVFLRLILLQSIRKLEKELSQKLGSKRSHSIPAMKRGDRIDRYFPTAGKKVRFSVQISQKKDKIRKFLNEN